MEAAIQYLASWSEDSVLAQRSHNSDNEEERMKQRRTKSEIDRYRVQVKTDFGPDQSNRRPSSLPPRPRCVTSDIGTSDYPVEKSIEVAHSSSLPPKRDKKRHRTDEEDEEIIFTPSEVKKKSHRHDPSAPERPSKSSKSNSQHRESTKKKRHKKRRRTDEEGKGIVFTPTEDKKKSHRQHSRLSERPRKSSKSKTQRRESTKKSSIDDEPFMPDEEGYVPLNKQTHFSWMPFGHARTWSAFALSALGLVLAILSKRSLVFVKLEQPLILSPHIEGITNVGQVRVQMCYTSEHINGQDESLATPYLNTAVNVHEGDPCFILRLTTDIIEDTMWDVSRLSSSMAIALGTFFCILLLSTVRWESINMKPVAVGLLITYLFQSFSFFFYDSHLCREHTCKLGGGTYLSIFASLCWFASAMIAIVMDVHHTRKMRRLARKERRRRRRLERRMKRKESQSTVQTDTSSSSSSLEDTGTLPLDDSGDPPVAEITEKHPDEEVLFVV